MKREVTLALKRIWPFKLERAPPAGLDKASAHIVRPEWASGREVSEASRN